ncbi:DUF1189 domain-containing protein [Pseudalkalibacillus caeni]|uniref:DUF1189 domain-containing protein n=1 Tax=Exobacillus caeni TaxID=2574798 RepID=A0A5R9F1K1_9BACL|nr:DUF1189 domain-containing protein [Pseudalkalibacillus caeni]TLS36296.1 DUF1189 domain-containing protein [Pseudalkalibacillus caeni]
MNIIQQFIKSFYAPKTVAAFRFQKFGKSILYVFFLMLIASVPVGVLTSVSFYNSFNELRDSMSEDIPDFKLENGLLSADMEKPYIDKDNDFTFIFDTTGEVKPDDVEEYNNVVALLKDEAIVVDPSGMQRMQYSTFGNISMTKDELLDLSKNIEGLLPVLIPIILVIAYIFQTGLKFIGISVLASIGLIFKNTMQRNLTYKQLWVLSAYAVTLPTIFFAIMGLLRITVSLDFLLYWFVAIMMLYLIIKEVPKPKKRA